MNHESRTGKLTCSFTLNAVKPAILLVGLSRTKDIIINKIINNSSGLSKDQRRENGEDTNSPLETALTRNKGNLLSLMPVQH